MRRIYLDYNATAPMLREALEAALPYYRDIWGNPSSIHRLGREARTAVDDAREEVARLLGASNPLDVVFTSSGTEAINLAIRGVAWGVGRQKRHLITTAVEHPATLDTCRALEQQGFTLTYLPVDGQGRVAPDTLAAAIRPDTMLLSLIHGNHEVGTLQPLADLIEVARAHGVPVHVDATQAVGHVEIEVEARGIDLLSFSGHKLGGPKGIGGLYIRDGLGATMQAVLHGGHQERERRAGTEDVPSIVALGSVCVILQQWMHAEGQRLAALRDRLEMAVRERIPGMRVLGDGAERLPNTSNLSFRGVKGEALVFNLDLLGIAVSTGASCTSRRGAPSQVLDAMGVSAEEREGSIRFSLGWGNTPDEIERVTAVLPSIVQRLRQLSPLF